MQTFVTSKCLANLHPSRRSKLPKTFHLIVDEAHPKKPSLCANVIAMLPQPNDLPLQYDRQNIRKSSHDSDSKKSIAALQAKNRVSERNSSFNNLKEHKRLPFLSKKKQDQSRFSREYENTLSIIRPVPFCSITMSASTVNKPQLSKMKRGVFDSAQSNHILSTMLQSKCGKSDKETAVGGDLSNLADNISKKNNFAWNLNISQQQFQIRKRKFDSQQAIIDSVNTCQHFNTVSKKQLKREITIEAEKHEEEEVVEEEIIRKLTDSKVDNSFGNTFDSHHSPQQAQALRPQEDSQGTIYESVYQ